jgi:hypothetical protein
MFKADRIKTTLMGLGTIIGSVYNFVSTKDLTSSISGFMAGIGLILAKDAGAVTPPAPTTK